MLLDVALDLINLHLDLAVNLFNGAAVLKALVAEYLAGDFLDLAAYFFYAFWILLVS